MPLYSTTTGSGQLSLSDRAAWWDRLADSYENYAPRCPKSETPAYWQARAAAARAHSLTYHAA